MNDEKFTETNDVSTNNLAESKQKNLSQVIWSNDMAEEFGDYCKQKVDAVLLETTANTKVTLDILLKDFFVTSRKGAGIFGKKIDETELKQLINNICAATYSPIKLTLKGITDGVILQRRDAREIKNNYLNLTNEFQIEREDRETKQVIDRAELNNDEKKLIQKETFVDENLRDIKDLQGLNVTQKIDLAEKDAIIKQNAILIQAQSNSIEKMSGQIEELTKKLAAVAEKAVTKGQESLTNNIKIND